MTYPAVKTKVGLQGYAFIYSKFKTQGFVFRYDLYVAKLHLDFLFEEIQMRSENKRIVGKNCKCSFINSPFTYDDKHQE